MPKVTQSRTQCSQVQPRPDHDLLAHQVASGDRRRGKVPGSQKEALVFRCQKSGSVLCLYLLAISLVAVNLHGFHPTMTSGLPLPSQRELWVLGPDPRVYLEPVSLLVLLCTCQALPLASLGPH